MKAYFTMNLALYDDEKNRVLVILNKMSKGWGATFAEWWYLKLIADNVPKDQKNFKKLCDDFEEALIMKHLQDWACQIIYSLSMDQFWGNFDQYTTAFRLAQAHSSIKADNILVDAL